MGRTTAFGQGGLSGLDRLLFAARARRLLAYLPAEARVVADLGCGFEARFLRRLQAEGRLETGIGVDLAVREFPTDDPIQTIRGDLNQDLPIPSDAVDAVVSLAVLEHLVEPERHLAEIQRILRPGGTLVLTTPTQRARPVLEFIAYRLHVIDAEEIRDHKHYFSRDELLDLARQSRFDPGRVQHLAFSLGFNQLLIASKPGGHA